jgi:ADP-heptose:LPS heptosyltransferase
VGVEKKGLDLFMRVRLLKILDVTVGFFLCWTTGYILHLFRRNAPAGASGVPCPDAIRRILVIRPGGMGDMILLQPMLRSLRQRCPQAEVDLVCEKRNRDIPALAGKSGRVILYDAHPFGLIGKLRRGQYDVVIDTEQFHYFSAIMAILSRAPVRIGFKINPGRNTLYTHLVNYDLEGYEAGEFMRLLVPLGIKDESVVKGCLTRPGRTEGRSGAVVIHVGASTRYKHWETGKFVDLVKRLAGAEGYASGPIILVGGRRETGLAGDISRQAGLGDRVKVMAGSLTIPQTADLIGSASLFIGGDSGLAHLAVALGTPTVVLFGPSDHKKWGASGQGNVVVRTELPCAPCFIFGYHKFCHSIACMSGITVEHVMTAVRRAIV